MFNKFFLNAGLGYGNCSLTSFDDALLNAGVGNYNLLKVSSILPAGCIQTDYINVIEGSPLHIAYASISSNIRKDIISAAVAVGIPTDKTKVGVIMEFSGHELENYAKKVVASMVEEAMKKRKYELDRILISSCEVSSSDGEYVTAFSGLAMW